MQEITTEYERRFILKDFPNDFDTYTKTRIEQWYLTKPDNPVSIRIRRYDDGRCYFDVKKGFGMEREKIGNKHEFKDIEIYTKNAYSMQKDRYKKQYDDYLMIIDIFDDGLKLIEIESKNKDIIQNFQPLDWFGEEVTNNIKYTNNYIAYDNYLKH